MTKTQFLLTISKQYRQEIISWSNTKFSDLASTLTDFIKCQLYDLQHGFLKGKSCVGQLLLVYNEIGKHLNAGLETDLHDSVRLCKGIWLCLPHQTDPETKLVWWLHGPLLTWFENYLSQPLKATSGHQWIFLKLEPVKVWCPSRIHTGTHLVLAVY